MTRRHSNGHGVVVGEAGEVSDEGVCSTFPHRQRAGEAQVVLRQRPRFVETEHVQLAGNFYFWKYSLHILDFFNGTTQLFVFNQYERSCNESSKYTSLLLACYEATMHLLPHIIKKKVTSFPRTKIRNTYLYFKFSKMPKNDSL